jgi:hypothetical protein
MKSKLIGQAFLGASCFVMAMGIVATNGHYAYAQKIQCATLTINGRPAGCKTVGETCTFFGLPSVCKANAREQCYCPDPRAGAGGNE